MLFFSLCHLDVKMCEVNGDVFLVLVFIFLYYSS